MATKIKSINDIILYIESKIGANNEKYIDLLYEFK